MNIREIRPTEYYALEEFLYHAIFIKPGTTMPPRKIIYEPNIFIYIDNFGEKDDCGVVAEQDGKIVGAAWTRIIPAYGHVDDETPELAISVLPEYRGQGVGTKMLSLLFDILRKRGYRRTSLSVQKENPAARLYRRVGYKIISENSEDYIMVKTLIKSEIDIDKLHTTELGEKRIRGNLCLDTENIILWCKQAVLAADSGAIVRKGKNWYVCGDKFVLTINANSHTIITAHKRDGKEQGAAI